MLKKSLTHRFKRHQHKLKRQSSLRSSSQPVNLLKKSITSKKFVLDDDEELELEVYRYSSEHSCDYGIIHRIEHKAEELLLSKY